MEDEKKEKLTLVIKYLLSNDDSIKDLGVNIFKSCFKRTDYYYYVIVRAIVYSRVEWKGDYNWAKFDVLYHYVKTSKNKEETYTNYKNMSDKERENLFKKYGF